MNTLFYNKIITILDKENVYIEELMAKHTTFRVGGPAEFFVMIKNKEELQKLLEICNEEDMPYYIIGNGSNLLVGDQGVRGVIIQIYQKMNDVQVEGNKLRIQAGALLAKVAKIAQNHELTGFEFAGGIPGTIGGAVAMNAGAYGGEMKDVIQEVVALSTNGEIKKLTLEELELGYRTSVIVKEGYVVLEVMIKLEKGQAEEIASRMDELKIQRTTKQPLEYPSGGSTFKRPEGYFAGKLIQDSGLRGFQIGGAQVSEKHCGFVVNTGNATAKDILDLTDHVVEIVRQKFGVTMEMEIKKIGEF